MVFEDGGIPATLGLRERDPFRQLGCQFKDPTCMVDPKTDCSQQGQVYVITCNVCQTEVRDTTRSGQRSTDPGGEPNPNYVGMTGTSLHARAISHTMAIKCLDNKNAMAKHTIEIHQGVSPGFKMSSMYRCKTVLRRHKSEGVAIEKQQDNSSLNSKLDRGIGGLIRLTPAINRC